MAARESVTPTVAPTELEAMDLSGRIPALRSRLDALGVDALVVSELTNVRYLTGFTGSSAVLVVRGDDAVFVTDGRYTTQSERELAESGVEAQIEISKDSLDDAAAGATASISRLGLEADSVTWSVQKQWAESLFEGELVPTTGVVEDLRMVKDHGEVLRIRAACAIADGALAEVSSRLADGLTEREFALELDAAMMRRGAEEVSFETIVAAGANGALPHHRPTGSRIVDGDLVVVDFGALVDGYHSDMTRTFMIGDVTEERRRMFDVVARAQAAGVDAVMAGAEVAQVDAACREVIAEAGWAEAFVHGTGHGVGLDIHEAPRVSSRVTDTLHDGHVVTVEPGIYLPGLGGVRIEDTVLVTRDGCERLTLAPKTPQLV